METLPKDLSDNILKMGGFSDQDISLLATKLRHRTLKKREFLLKRGEVCGTLCFVGSGCFHHYYLDDKNEQKTLGLSAKNDWVFDQQSLVNQKPSQAFIQAFENSEVFELHLYSLHELIEESRSFFRIGQIFAAGSHHSVMLKSEFSSEKKYLDLLAERPLILQKFPLKYIASYLGMTPEHLSRVRRGINHRGN